MEDKVDKTLGRIAYEAFMGVVDVDREDMLELYKEAWEEAAKAVVNAACKHDNRVCICDGVPLKDGSSLINPQCQIHGFTGYHG